MDHYLDVRILPDPEFQATLLMNALFSKLHRALARRDRGDIGVSFPDAHKTLGETLRVHGYKESLVELMAADWLRGMRDHIVINDIVLVPEDSTHRVIRRAQAKSSVDRLRRRSIKKGWLNEEEARRMIPESKEQRLKQPFLEITSRSTNQKFRLFIDQSKEIGQPVPGRFSSYGLSSEASVPWF